MQDSGPSSMLPGAIWGLLSTAPQEVLLGGSLGHPPGGQQCQVLVPGLQQWGFGRPLGPLYLFPLYPKQG